KPVKVRVEPGTQDDLSVQLQVMRDLQMKRKPSAYLLFDKNQTKKYEYTSEGTARIDTALGPLDTVIYTAHRSGSPRVTRSWFAPSLGYLAVKAEQFRKDQSEWSMEIHSLK